MGYTETNPRGPWSMRLIQNTVATDLREGEACSHVDLEDLKCARFNSWLGLPVLTMRFSGNNLRSLLLTCVGTFALIRVRVSAGRGVASGDGGVGGGGTPWYQM